MSPLTPTRRANDRLWQSAITPAFVLISSYWVLNEVRSCGKCGRCNNRFRFRFQFLDKGLTMAIMVSFCATGVQTENCSLPPIDAITWMATSFRLRVPVSFVVCPESSLNWAHQMDGGRREEKHHQGQSGLLPFGVNSTGRGQRAADCMPALTRALSCGQWIQMHLKCFENLL